MEDRVHFLLTWGGSGEAVQYIYIPVTAVLRVMLAAFPFSPWDYLGGKRQSVRLPVPAMGDVFSTGKASRHRHGTGVR